MSPGATGEEALFWTLSQSTSLSAVEGSLLTVLADSDLCPLGPNFSARVMLGCRAPDKRMGRSSGVPQEASPLTPLGPPVSPSPSVPQRGTSVMAGRGETRTYTGSINPLILSFIGNNKCPC